jgi:hypothetical protein
MDKSSSPEVGRARGAHSPSHGNNENSDTQLLPDQDLLGNIRRRLINAQSGADAFEVFTLSVHYEVRTADQQWIFAERWQAILQQNRLSIELAAKEGAHRDS